MPKNHVRLLATLSLAAVVASQSFAETAISIMDTGLSSIKVDGTELLASANLSVQRVQAGGAFLPPGKPTTSFDPATKTQTTAFDWGKISARWSANDNELTIELNVTNTSDQAIDAYTINPLQLNSFGDSTRVSRPADGVSGPPLVTVEGPTASMVAALGIDPKPAIITVGEGADSKTKSPRLNPQVTLGGDKILVDNVTAARPLAPGATDQVRMTLRFGKSGTDPVALATPELDAYRKAFPPLLSWKDRRPILRLFFGGGLPKEQALANLQNPDQIQVPAVDEKFRKHILDRMASTVEAAKAIDAQAVILWDLEGGTFPHAVTYIGDPRLIRVLNPQMDLVIDDAAKILREGGLRVGVTLRPSRVVYSEEKKTATHSHTVAEDPYRELEAKVLYAKERWGCTVFYVDTNFFWRPYGPEKKWQSGQIAQDVWARLYQKFPDTLFIPEFGNVVDYRATLPYGEADMGNYGTPELARALYPESFRVIVVEDADPYENFERFVQAVREKNTLMTYGFAPGSPNVISIGRINRAAAILESPAPGDLATADVEALLKMIEGDDAARAYRAGERLRQMRAPVDPARLLAVAVDSKRDWLVRYAALKPMSTAGQSPDIDSILGLLLSREEGLYAGALETISVYPDGVKQKLLDRLQSIVTAGTGNRWQIQQIGKGLAAIKATDAAVTMKAMFEQVPEGKNQQSLRRSIVDAMSGLANTELTAFYAGLMPDPAYREPAATALVQSGAPDARKRVEDALAAARKDADKIAIEQLTRALRAK